MDVTGASLYLLDTNIAGCIVSGRSPMAREAFERISADAEVTISAITEAEILFDLQTKPEATRLRTVVETLFAAIDVRPFDSNAAHAYARLRAQLKAAGKSLSGMDLLIASHALALGATLVSHDRAFQQVAPWVTIADWAVVV